MEGAPGSSSGSPFQVLQPLPAVSRALSDRIGSEGRREPLAGPLGDRLPLVVVEVERLPGRDHRVDDRPVDLDQADAVALLGVLVDLLGDGPDPAGDARVVHPGVDGGALLHLAVSMFFSHPLIDAVTSFTRASAPPWSG